MNTQNAPEALKQMPNLPVVAKIPTDAEVSSAIDAGCARSLAQIQSITQALLPCRYCRCLVVHFVKSGRLYHCQCDYCERQSATSRSAGRAVKYWNRAQKP